jgi:DNA-binding response OmpR family regulator
MTERLCKVLLIEDDEDDYILTRETLAEVHGEKFQLTWASTYEAGWDALTSGEYDAVLMDYDLGPHTGLDLTREANLSGCKAPIILLTGRGNYEVDVEAMKAGATDYLAKSEVTPRLLERTIRYSILRKQNEDALLKTKEELEVRVQERTHELSENNIALLAEIQERRRIEA